MKHSENISRLKIIYKNYGEKRVIYKNIGKKLHWPGIEPGSTAWKAAMLTIIPPMLSCMLW